MKLFLGKNWPSFIFPVSLTILGVYLALILIGDQTDKERLGAFIGSVAAICLVVSMYLTITNRNKKDTE